MMNSKLKFAIIGCGRIANGHAEHIQKHEELVAVYEHGCKALVAQQLIAISSSIATLVLVLTQLR